MTMHLKILLPTDLLLHEPVNKIVAEAENGSFGILPRHVDFVAALVPGILIYATADGTEHFIAVDEGILVKCANEVLVSTRNAIPGEDLSSLRQSVKEQFMILDERQRSARSALARLEASVIRRFIDHEKQI